MHISNSLFSLLLSSSFSQGPFSFKLLSCIAIFTTFPLSTFPLFLVLSYTYNRPVGELISLHRTSLTGDGLPLLTGHHSALFKEWVCVCTVKLVPTSTEHKHIKVSAVPEGFPCRLCTIHDGPRWQKDKRRKDVTGAIMSCLSLAHLLSPTALNVQKCDTAREENNVIKS